jgi:hypothetical protein
VRGRGRRRSSPCFGPVEWRTVVRPRPGGARSPREPLVLCPGVQAAASEVQGREGEQPASALAAARSLSARANSGLEEARRLVPGRASPADLQTTPSEHPRAPEPERRWPHRFSPQAASPLHAAGMWRRLPPALRVRLPAQDRPREQAALRLQEAQPARARRQARRAAGRDIRSARRFAGHRGRHRARVARPRRSARRCRRARPRPPSSRVAPRRNRDARA